MGIVRGMAVAGVDGIKGGGVGELRGDGAKNFDFGSLLPSMRINVGTTFKINRNFNIPAHNP